MGVLEFVSLLAIYLEIAILAFCDYKIWRTVYTPLNMLILPYAVMLLVTILASGNMGIVNFYYPSLAVWMVGIIIFALPSYILGLPLSRKMGACEPTAPAIEDNINMRTLNVLTVILLAMFLARFVLLVRTSQYLPGSEDFGYEYCGGGLWGHLHRVLHALSIIYIYKYDRQHKIYLLFVAGMFFVTLMYGVKSWVLIPAIGGICMRLYAGKMQLKFSLFVKVLFFAFVVFFVTYSFSLFLGKEDAAAFGVIFEIICENFVHYVISGIMGWSQDLEMGILESERFDVLLTNILNIYNAIVGGEYVDPVNPFFIHNGVKGSNVRAFFGTIYINANIIQFVIVVFAVSVVHYLVYIWARKSRDFFVNIVFFFYGGMLLMGWFEIYFYHLQFLEVPACVLLLYMLAGRRRGSVSDAQIHPAQA